LKKKSILRKKRNARGPLSSRKRKRIAPEHKGPPLRKNAMRGKTERGKCHGGGLRRGEGLYGFFEGKFPNRKDLPVRERGNLRSTW